MAAHPNPFVIARNKWVVPKQRRVERLASGYSIREFRNDSQGRYWYVVTTIEVDRPRSAEIVAGSEKVSREPPFSKGAMGC